MKPALNQELLAALPEVLRTFVSRGGTTLQTENDDWEIGIRRPAPYLTKALPEGAVLIGDNGVGDHLFLVPAQEDAARLDGKVQIYWHEGPEITLLTEDIDTLVNPPAPTPTTRAPVLYHEGQTAVQLGDHVTARSFFRRKPGRVVYLPGVSAKNRDMEHHGLSWVGIDLENGLRLATVVIPETSRLKKSVVFVSRSTGPYKPMGPRERLE